MNTFYVSMTVIGMEFRRNNISEDTHEIPQSQSIPSRDPKEKEN